MNARRCSAPELCAKEALRARGLRAKEALSAGAPRQSHLGYSNTLKKLVSASQAGTVEGVTPRLAFPQRSVLLRDTPFRTVLRGPGTKCPATLDQSSWDGPFPTL